MRSRMLFALWVLALVAMSHSAWAQCPPTAPTFVFPGSGAYSVDEGSTVPVAVTGGGPLYEWDADCNGVTPSRGDHIGPSSSVFTAQDRDGPSVVRFCVRSFNPTCPMGMQFSAFSETPVRVTNAPPTITTNQLPTAVETLPYSITLAATDPANPPTASMVRDPLMWSAAGLPAGLSINAATGEISGTPTVNGVFTVTVTATDGDGGSNTVMLRLFVAPMASGSPMRCGTPTITPAGVGGGFFVDEGSSTRLNAVTASPACQCQIAWDIGCDGSVDLINPVVGVSAQGLDGPPNSIPVCATAVVAGGAGGMVCLPSERARVSVQVVNVAPTITTMSLPAGSVGVPYVAQVEATDPANPPLAGGYQDAFTWSAIGLPPGLSINPSTGVISGTPSMMGVFPVTVTVVDGDGGTATTVLRIVIDGAMMGMACPNPVLSLAGMRPMVNEGGSTTLMASLPAPSCACVIQWDVDCNGMVDGTGNSFTLSGVNRDGPSGLVLCLRAIHALTSTCTMPSGDVRTDVAVLNVPPTITTMALPMGAIGVPYTATVTASDPANPPIASSVQDPIRWSAAGLPPGLSIDMNTGVISGTPSSMASPRCYEVRVTAEDGDGGSDTRVLQLCLLMVPPMSCAPALPASDGWTAPEGGSTTLTVAFGAGGSCGCTVEWDFGCDGSVDATGLMVPFSAVGLDGPSLRNVCWVSRPSPMGPCTGPSPSSTNVVRITNVAPTITTMSIPDAMVGVSYSTTITATDPANPPVSMSVQDPLVWSLMGAPSWLSINPMTGVISGTPPMSAAGMTFTFTVNVNDGDGGTTSRSYQLRVLPMGMMDGGVDSGVDSGVDASLVDARPDVPIDVMPDIGVDGGVDASADAVDASVDTSIADSATDAIEVDAVLPDGSVDDVVVVDASIDAGDDVSVTDASIDDAPPSDGAVARDARPADGASSDGGAGMLTGDGTCACRAAGAPASRSSARAQALLTLMALAWVARKRSRRRTR